MYCLLNLINLIFNIKIDESISKLVYMRVFSIASFAFIATFITVVQTKVWGIELSLVMITAIGLLIQIPQLFVGWFQHTSLKRVRNTFLICDSLEAFGYLAYGLTSNILILTLCYVLSQIINTLVANVYHWEIERYINNHTDENQYATFKSACRSYSALAGFIGSGLVFCLSLLIDNVQIITFILGIICVVNTWYTNTLVNDLIRNKEYDEQLNFT